MSKAKEHVAIKPWDTPDQEYLRSLQSIILGSAEDRDITRLLVLMRYYEFSTQSISAAQINSPAQVFYARELFDTILRERVEGL